MIGILSEGSGNVTIINSNITNSLSTPLIYNTNNSATIKINSGTLISAGNVIYNESTGGTIIIGEKDEEVNNDLKLETNSNYTAVVNNGALYYYDGIIKGKTSIMGGVIEIEKNTYIDISQEDNLEIASLKPLEYIVEVTNENYTNEKCKTLQEAITKCSNTANSTIKIIKDFTITESNKGIVEEAQDITIDLNEHTITSFSTEDGIKNNGTLKITDLSSEKSGKIISKGKAIIQNIGTLTTENITMQLNKSGVNNQNITYIINNLGQLTINSGNLIITNGLSNVSVLYNNLNGTVQINGGSITSNGNNAIYNNSTGTITIKEASISSGIANAIYNNSEGKIIIDGATITAIKSSSGGISVIYNNIGTIEIKSGAIVGGNNGVENKSGIVNMFGGSIDVESDGINNSGSGSVTVAGGNIKSNNRRNT